ncbi:MAG: hypothetical protein ABJG41_01480 [Cyclobacteriaceae bacterium]
MYIEHTRILEETDGGLRIILDYYPQAEPAVTKKGHKFKLRGTEKTASATLKKLQDGNWVVTDFGGDQVPRNAIHVCQLEENIDFGQACQMLAERYKVGAETLSPEIYKPEISSRDANPDEEDGTWFFEVRDHFTDLDITTVLSAKVIPYLKKEKESDNKTIDRDKVQRVFKKYHFYALTSYSIVKNRKVTTISSTDHYPIMMWDEGEFKKIYQPLSPDKSRRFIYYGKRPKDFLHGFSAAKQAHTEFNRDRKLAEDLEEGEEPPREEKLPEILYCSGGSDALNMAIIGYQVVWPNSETAKLSEKQFIQLAKLAEKVMNVPDIDSTGKREAHKLALKHLELYTLWLPLSLSQRRDRRGNPCKDVRDYFRYYNAYDFKQLVATALPYQFWGVEYQTKKNGAGYKKNYTVKNTRLYNFLGQSGFYRLELENEKTGYIYIRIEGNIVREIKSNEVKQFIHDFLRERMMEEDLRDTFFRSTQLGEASMSNLPIIEVDFTDFDKDTQFFFFENRTIKVTKDKIEDFKPGEIDRYVWGDEVINHRYTTQEDHFRIFKNDDNELDIEIKKSDNIFFNYLINTSRMFWRKELEENLAGTKAEEREKYLKQHRFDIAGPTLSPEEIREQKRHLINKIYSLGYLLHRHKSPSRPWAVFAMDHRVSDDGESHGGSGKSICFKAPRFFMKSVTLDGRKPKLTDDQFIYENVTRHTDYILVDDANQYLNFQFFFAPLTGELTVNPKNNQRFIIPFKEVPKFSITSNFVVRNLDSSTERRLLYTVFSDYYHQNSNDFYLETRQPKDDFGKEILNEEFTEEEWNDFYNFMMQCCRFYMNHDKIEPPMNNVEKRNLISEMGNAFHEWADVYFSEDSEKLNCFVVKNEAFDEFKRASKTNWTSQKFGKALKAWAKYYGYELDPKEYHNGQGRITRKHTAVPGGKAISTEMIYIRTSASGHPEGGRQVPVEGQTDTENSLQPKDDMPF